MAGALGLIPAHAGKTLRTESVLSVLRAHPRSRGENHSVLPRLPSADGSSPLTRGKPRGGQRPRRLPGLIPAHAGKTRSSPPRRIRLPAHPRSRGENWLGNIDALAGFGSSPLTRGKRLDNVLNRVDAGLIPAHAGKTIGQMCRSICSTAHPRSRGENSTVSLPITERNGSSPLTRGKLIDLIVMIASVRLIPAHAGKTAPRRQRGVSGPAHPRSRGENSPASEPQMPTPGSSPLTRGKHPDDGADGGRLGLIPAHAGKTRPASSTGRFTGAHPRSRGENTVWPYPEENEKGSSPLTRGKPPRWRGRPPRVRLIPAHAGKTAAWRA